MSKSDALAESLVRNATLLACASNAITLLEEVIAYRRGLGKYNFAGLPSQERENAAFDAWEELQTRIEYFLKQST